jgi:hypothetical protein
MRLACFECEPTEEIKTTGEKITLADGSKIVTELPATFTMPRKLREVSNVNGNDIATLSCGHKRSLFLRFSGEQE